MSSLSSVAASVIPGMGSLLYAVIALGILVFVHEFGHFLFAKLSGVGVLKFSLGFGKKIIGKKIGETEYMVSAIPLGGYVKMLGGEGAEDESELELSEEDKKRTFMAQPLWKRMGIVLAGPMFNIFLAVVLCYMLFVTGFPTPIAKVAGVLPGSPAAAAGFMAGDVVQKVGSEDVGIWEQVTKAVQESPGKELAFSVRRGDKTVELKAAPVKQDGKGYIGLLGSVVIGSVRVGSPADKAGMQVKDRVVAVEGRKVGAWDEMASLVKVSIGKPLKFAVERDGRPMEVVVTPASMPDNGKQVGMIGVMNGSELEDVAYGPIESIGMSVDRTLFLTEMTVGFLARLVRGKEDASQLGGPVAIVQMSGRQARQGFADFVIFMAFLSVNLGVINLVPIPILDGGLLLIMVIEAVLGRELTLRHREIAQQVGLFMLVALMVFVFYNDIMRLLGLSDMWK